MFFGNLTREGISEVAEGLSRRIQIIFMISKELSNNNSSTALKIISNFRDDIQNEMIKETFSSIAVLIGKNKIIDAENVLRILKRELEVKLAKHQSMLQGSDL